MTASSKMLPLLGAVGLLLTTGGARGDSLLFTNGGYAFPMSSIDTINSTHQVSDDFTLSAAATLDRAVFAELTLNLNGTVAPVPATVHWCIGTSAFGTNVCGTGSITVTPGGSSGFLHDFSSNFTLPGLSLAAGTYYLTLSDGTDTLAQTCPSGPCPHNNDYWSSTIFRTGDAQLLTINPTNGTTSTGPLNNEAAFQIYGTVGSTTRVPEPGTLLLLAGGLLAIARRRRAAI